MTDHDNRELLLILKSCANTLDRLVQLQAEANAPLAVAAAIERLAAAVEDLRGPSR